jgi:REP element-mobilizing transposase RayT
MAGGMARKLRMEYEGAIYHVMNRGDRREAIFKDDRDRELFLETLGQACLKTDWQVHAWCLMNNHFHLVVETSKANLVSGMKWFLGTYTGRFNRRHKLFGHLFSGRYKALIVDGSGTGYLRTVCDYVHLNPVRAKLLSREQQLTGYRWSSYGEYLKRPVRRVSWLRVGRLFGEMGIPKDSAAGRKEFERRMELRRWEDQPEQWKRVRRGWCLGGNAFRKKLLAQIAEKVGTSHYGEELRESAEEKAQRIVTEELKRVKWAEADLERNRKGDPRKVKVARRLRGETTMTLKWIADRLKMGTWTHVANRLYHVKK